MDIATAALTPVSEGARPASVSQARFTPDGRGVYLITNRDSEFEQLRRVDLVTGAVEMLTGHIPWDIDSFARSDDGRYLAWVANVDGVSRLTVIDVAQRIEILPPLPDGRIGRIGFRSHRQAPGAVAREPAVAARRVRARTRAQRGGALHEERGRARRSAAVRAGRADSLPHLRSRQRQAPADSRVRLSARRHAGAASRCSSTFMAGPNRRPCRAAIRSRNSWCAKWASW